MCVKNGPFFSKSLKNKKEPDRGSKRDVNCLSVTVTHTAYLDNGTATGLTVDIKKITSGC